MQCSFMLFFFVPHGHKECRTESTLIHINTNTRNHSVRNKTKHQPVELQPGIFNAVHMKEAKTRPENSRENHIHGIIT